MKAGEFGRHWSIHTRYLEDHQNSKDTLAARLPEGGYPWKDFACCFLIIVRQRSVNSSWGAWPERSLSGSGRRAIKRFCRLGAEASSIDIGEEDGESEDIQLLRFSSALGYIIET